MKALFICVLPLLLVSVVSAADTFDIYVLDTEGGKAVILTTPQGQTMLIDAGYPTRNDRDTNRIVEAAQALKIKEFDYIVATHYDADHAGNVPNLAARIPAKVYIDHGEVLPGANERDKKNFYEPYINFVADKKRMKVKPGDEIPMKDLKIMVVSSGGKAITEPLPGAGQPNELFADTTRPDITDVYDNAGSVGLLFEFGSFRMLDLADQLQPGEYDLVYPNNLIGKVDLFMVSHHGFKVSNSKILIHTIRPKVAVMNNGPRKGGEAEVFDVLTSSPGFEDLWQLHYAERAGKEKNRPEQFIANIESPCQAKMIKISAQRDGAFTVTNTRNDFSKTYKP
ncbi:MAG: MBL fold metallo-hydrolase [Sedimentisphaerales bacterium]|nr:MBL fold metallo-hydrolase [Sedimentisphaerales bacterium]